MTEAATPRGLYPRIRGDLRLRPVASAIALAVGGLGGATVGILVGGFEGVLLGSALGWSVSSFGDTVAAAAERRAAARARALEEELPRLRELEVNEQGDARLHADYTRRLDRLFYER